MHFYLLITFMCRPMQYTFKTDNTLVYVVLSNSCVILLFQEKSLGLVKKKRENRQNTKSGNKEGRREKEWRRVSR